jgi:hypothetical protein
VQPDDTRVQGHGSGNPLVAAREEHASAEQSSDGPLAAADEFCILFLAGPRRQQHHAAILLSQPLAVAASALRLVAEVNRLAATVVYWSTEPVPAAEFARPLSLKPVDGFARVSGGFLRPEPAATDLAVEPAAEADALTAPTAVNDPHVTPYSL